MFSLKLSNGVVLEAVTLAFVGGRCISRIEGCFSATLNAFTAACMPPVNGVSSSSSSSFRYRISYRPSECSLFGDSSSSGTAGNDLADLGTAKFFTWLLEGEGGKTYEGLRSRRS